MRILALVASFKISSVTCITSSPGIMIPASVDSSTLTLTLPQGRALSGTICLLTAETILCAELMQEEIRGMKMLGNGFAIR